MGSTTLTDYAMGITFALSIVYMLIAIFSKEENEKKALFFSIHSLLMCIALGVWDLVTRT